VRILYEDNHLIGVYKPAGMLTQGDRSGDPNLMDAVKRWIAERYQKPGQVFLGLMHRLDRPVSGVILFAKTSKAASRVSEQFRLRTVGKRYRARLEGVISPASGRLQHFIAQSDSQRGVTVSSQSLPDSKLGSLSYDTVRREAQQCTVSVALETGRKHQIRAQFAHVGHPIVGDRLYGSRTRNASEAIALCAVRLTLAHPISKQPLVIELPEELLPPLLR
jgi:23S rRNA pseudouridine1911/1915/1917 synthase